MKGSVNILAFLKKVNKKSIKRVCVCVLAVVLTCVWTVCAESFFASLAMEGEPPSF